ncbi:MAG: hypothetical protein JHD35_03580 [Sphingopyxis sp.]|nr:hypothetical protein [Sphingopyxis sp.]
MKGQLFCTTCGAPLSNELNFLSTKDPAVEAPTLADQQPVTDHGTAYKSDKPFITSFDEPNSLDFVAQIWTNPDDVEAFTELVGDSRRLGGCCGLSGCGGPNIRCKSCKAEIGTKMTDCWTPYLFIADPDGTELRKLET